MTSRQEILILYNLPPQAPPVGAPPGWLHSVTGVLDQVGAVQQAIEQTGRSCRLRGLSGIEDLDGVLAEGPATLIFNLVENFTVGEEESVRVPELCEAAGRGVTGNSTACLRLAQDKDRTRQLLAAAGLPVPPGVAVPPGRPVPADLPPGPWIIKPALTDGSEGILPSSIVSEAGPPLQAAVAQIHQRFQQPALIEKLIGRREVNVALIERDGCVEALSLSEIDFSRLPPDRPRIVDYQAKWIYDSVECQSIRRLIPAPLPPELAERIRTLARAAWCTIGCRDYARVDFRLDENDQPFILEVNPNPDIGPLAGLPAALQVDGIPYTDFIVALLENARARRARFQGLESPNR